MILWIALAGIVVTAAALWYLSLFGPLRTHLVVATVAGVFVSVMLGCGLFAAASYSDKSGHDDAATQQLSDRESPLDALPTTESHRRIRTESRGVGKKSA